MKKQTLIVDVMVRKYSSLVSHVGAVLLAPQRRLETGGVNISSGDAVLGTTPTLLPLGTVPKQSLGALCISNDTRAVGAPVPFATPGTPVSKDERDALAEEIKNAQPTTKQRVFVGFKTGGKTSKICTCLTIPPQWPQLASLDSDKEWYWWAEEEGTPVSYALVEK